MQQRTAYFQLANEERGTILRQRNVVPRLQPRLPQLAFGVKLRRDSSEQFSS